MDQLDTQEQLDHREGQELLAELVNLAQEVHLATKEALVHLVP
jgi:hypothetical protein